MANKSSVEMLDAINSMAALNHAEQFADIFPKQRWRWRQP